MLKTVTFSAESKIFESKYQLTIIFTQSTKKQAWYNNKLSYCYNNNDEDTNTNNNNSNNNYDND